jgi:hypothetical protein
LKVGSVLIRSSVETDLYAVADRFEAAEFRVSVVDRTVASPFARGVRDVVPDAPERVVFSAVRDQPDVRFVGREKISEVY